ncbi:condensation domain-containing protein [Streptomyces griseoloalbus]|uniref:Condensation domain-containing protein n=1 Tax=Streptomyces griseoloalbus TaxID=67303 RepID=A0ABV3E1F1_9ACTN
MNQRLDDRRARLVEALRAQRRTLASERLPLTATQQGIWIAEQLSPGVSGYHDTAVLRMDGPLDTEALRLAFGDARAVHEAMRCRVVETDGEPLQSFDAPAPDVAYSDLGAVGPQTRGARVERLAALAATEPFDLEAGPLWRARLVRLSADEHVLILVVHHLISDGWSHGVLLRSLLSHYAARSRNAPPPAVPDGDGYRTWLLHRVAQERAAVEGGRARHVAGLLSHAPYRVPLPGRDDRAGDRLSVAVGLPVAQRTWTVFDRACRRAGATPYMGLTGLFGLLLARTTGGRTAVLASPVALRAAPGTADLMGCLINVVPVAVRILPPTGPAQAVAAGRDAVLTALRYADVPYRDVARALGPLPTADDPVTNVGVEEFNAPEERVRLGDLTVEPQPRGQVRLRHDLALSIPRNATGAQLLHPVGRWSPGESRSFAERLAELIGEAATASARDE